MKIKTHFLPKLQLLSVIPAKAGNQSVDSRLRGNDSARCRNSARSLMAVPSVVVAIAASTLAGCNSSAPTDETRGEMKAPAMKTSELKVGDTAPAFALKDQNNASHNLSESKGKFVVLAFYPADMTGGCTIEAHKFTESLPEFQKRKTQVFGVSVQDVKSKKEFCDKEGIKYPLLADETKSAARAYGVLGDSGVANRVTFIVAPNGKIAAVNRDVQPISSASDALMMLDKAQKAGS